MLTRFSTVWILSIILQALYFKIHSHKDYIRKDDIRVLVLLTFFNSLRKSDKMLGKPRILSFFLNSFNKINKTWALK